MKNYILTIAGLVLFTSLVQTAFSSECNLKLLVKKSTAKTAYTVAGDTVSKSMMLKLSKVCTITKVKMSDDMKKAMKIKRLKQQLAKLSK